MKSTFLSNVTLATVMLCSSAAQASILKYEFGFVSGKTASALIDDSLPSIGAGPFSTGGGSAYVARSLVIDGVTVSGAIVTIMNDSQGKYDYVYFSSPDLTRYIVMGGMPGLFADESLTQLAGLTFSDFGGARNYTNYSYPLGLMSSMTVSVENAVPEPASIALFGMGLGGLAALRRRPTAATLRDHA